MCSRVSVFSYVCVCLYLRACVSVFSLCLCVSELKSSRLGLGAARAWGGSGAMDDEPWGDAALETPVKAKPYTASDRRTPPPVQRPSTSSQSEFAEGLGGASDEEHLKMCRSGCSRCSWIKNRHRRHDAVGPWLDARLDPAKRTFCLGCGWCCASRESLEVRQLGLGGWDAKAQFARFEVQGPFKLQKFQKHKTQPSHVAAESVMNATSIADDKAAPGASKWKEVLKRTQDGSGTSSKGIAGVGSRHKVRRMQWCLSEGKRMLSRKRLKNALSVSIKQDKRGTRYLGRYRCCGRDLKPKEGILQLARDVATPSCTGADALRKRTIQALEYACTPTAPPGVSKPQPPIDMDLFTDLVAKVECFAADGASDEQLAGRELASSLNMAGPSVQKLQDVLVQDLAALKAVGLVAHVRLYVCMRVRVLVGSST